MYIPDRKPDCPPEWDEPEPEASVVAAPAMFSVSMLGVSQDVELLLAFTRTRTIDSPRVTDEDGNHEFTDTHEFDEIVKYRRPGEDWERVWGNSADPMRAFVIALASALDAAEDFVSADLADALAAAAQNAG